MPWCCFASGWSGSERGAFGQELAPQVSSPSAVTWDGRCIVLRACPIPRLRPGSLQQE